MIDILEKHLQASWMTPEQIVIDAHASMLIEKYAKIRFPSIEIGCGDGQFTHLTFGEKDQFDIGLDHSIESLHRAKATGRYRFIEPWDANKRWPVGDGSMQTVFSNMLYWLDSPKWAFDELARVLKRGGHAYVCIPNETFAGKLMSYRNHSPWANIINGGRRDHLKWTLYGGQVHDMAWSRCMVVEGQFNYGCTDSILWWDIGTRPFRNPLRKILSKISPADKQEWIDYLRPYVKALWKEERENILGGAFSFYAIKKS